MRSGQDRVGLRQGGVQHDRVRRISGGFVESTALEVLSGLLNLDGAAHPVPALRGRSFTVLRRVATAESGEYAKRREKTDENGRQTAA
jgi:hypothetical protein